MDRRSRICTAGGVFLAGLAVALPFREEKAQPPAAAAPSEVALQSEPRTPPLASTNPGAPIAPAATPGGPSTAQTQVPRATPEGPASAIGAGHGAANPPTAPRRYGPPRRHKVVDGDTLPGLALRYLGSVDFAGEIFAVNRDVLLSPELLPIGVELTIPSEGAIPAPAGSRPMVPVP